ncbi:hypothetical protein L3Y34_002129 [Caenorhabditis briggsae]|uniref:C2H2-type domain-containing protein n=1 Tax=Caenorhabditis briggsae TaxID=6238 RepID=A0AAE9DE10_CAEBR|nr:hypothetical protein L3Y34_002129 [Caenorhabditis briggsae]
MSVPLADSEQESSDTEKKEEFPCLNCGQVYASKRNLDFHQTTKQGRCAPKNFQCEFCDKKFVSRGSWNIHRSSLHGAPKIFSELGLRMEATRQFSEKSYCALCGKPYSGERSLKQHLRTAHEVSSLPKDSQNEKQCTDELDEFAAELVTYMKNLEDAKASSLAAISPDGSAI